MLNLSGRLVALVPDKKTAVVPYIHLRSVSNLVKWSGQQDVDIGPLS